jgi:hypothetical protein
MRDVKERPILFSAPMVRAILDGSKTQTRRIVKPQPEHGVTPCHWSPTGHAVTAAPHNERGDTSCTCKPIRAPYGAPGDRLWVRETHAPRYFDDGSPSYRADWTALAAATVPQPKWTPAIHMRRADSRILLEVTDVRVERLQAITEEDARAEGVGGPPLHPGPDFAHRTAFAVLWDEINGKRAPWESNPWVWVVSFQRAGASR